MKPMTPEEVRRWLLAECPADMRPRATDTEALWSTHDNGLSAGLVGQARVF